MSVGVEPRCPSSGKSHCPLTGGRPLVYFAYVAVATLPHTVIVLPMCLRACLALSALLGIAGTVFVRDTAAWAVGVGVADGAGVA